MRAHLTPVIGAQPLPWPHEPTQMGENYDEVEKACAGASWFMGRCKAHWTKEQHAAESLRRENETLARKIKREALKAKTLLAVIALIGLQTLTISAADSLTPVALALRVPPARVAVSPTLSVGENFLNAVAMVESSRNPSAIGDGGKATGEFQLHQAARQDARKLLGRAGTDRELARAYLTSLAQRLEAKLGRKPSYSQVYAAYNMGYVGFSRRNFDVSKTPATTQRACKRIEGMMK